MSELQFESSAPKCLAENLVTKANSENRHVTLNQFAHSCDRIPQRRRIPWPVGKKNASGFVSQCFGSRSGGGQHCNFETVLPQSAQDVVFHPIVKSDDWNVCRRQWCVSIWR